MDKKRMIELLEIEHECMLRGAHDDCDRNCADCELVQDDEELHEMYTNVIALLKEQQPKTGHWIDSAGNDKCSICGEEYSDLYPDYGNTHFCPNCGAKMEGR